MSVSASLRPARLPSSFPPFVTLVLYLPSFLPGLLRVVVVGGQVVLYCLCRPFIHSTHLFVLSNCRILTCLGYIPESHDPTIHQSLGFFLLCDAETIDIGIHSFHLGPPDRIDAHPRLRDTAPLFPAFETRLSISRLLWRFVQNLGLAC